MFTAERLLIGYMATMAVLVGGVLTQAVWERLAARCRRALARLDSWLHWTRRVS